MLVSSQDGREGHEPAEVVRQFRGFTANSQLIVGGYRNKQASILQRRHEFFPLRPGWDSKGEEITRLISLALEIKTQLRNKLYGFAKASGATGVNEKAESMFYHQSESIIHETLRAIDWNRPEQHIIQLRDNLIRLSWRIFEQATSPYAHEPGMIKALATARKSLNKAFTSLKGT